MGVKKGCLLAPLLLKMFLFAFSLLATDEPDETQHEISHVRLRYRFYGGVFNLQKLSARPLVGYVPVRDLHYADDETVLTGGLEVLQTKLTQTYRHYSRLGLLMNKMKTDIMYRQ